MFYIVLLFLMVLINFRQWIYNHDSSYKWQLDKEIKKNVSMFGFRKESRIHTWTELWCLYLLAEEKAMYSAELEKHKREKAEWRKRAETAEDKTAALQVSTNSHIYTSASVF